MTEAMGTEHTLEYALRVPGTGGPHPLEEAATAGPLRESLAATTPLVGEPVGQAGSGTRPARYSLASVACVGSSDPCPAILTAAKPAADHAADLIVRIYQAKNAPLELELATAIDAGDTVGNTALEGPLSPDRAADLAIGPAASSVTFTAPRALTTLRIKEKKK